MSKCILVVDDDEAIRELLCLYFEAKGFRVEAAADPYFCQAVVTDSPCLLDTPCCDIIIVDFSMPKMNGLDFLEKRVKRGCKGSLVPSALISGCLPEGAEKRLEQIGCVCFPKPIPLTTILKWIESLPE